MSKHIPFPDIGQFRNAIRNVSELCAKHQLQETTCPEGYACIKCGKSVPEPSIDNGGPCRVNTKPTLTYEGTVKLHGTNAAIVIQPGENADEVWFQSRERILTLEKDNAGFAAHFTPQITKLLSLRVDFLTDCWVNPGDRAKSTLVIYGEWCGEGVQKGVGIASLPKMFVVFAVRFEDEQGNRSWAPAELVATLRDPSIGIYNIYDYPTYQLDIDFENPQLKQNELGEITKAVEAECPVAKALGVAGVGEGVVWKCITPGWESSDYWFKVKGEKHSVTKVKTLAQVDTVKLENVAAFVAAAVTDARCHQGISKLREAGLPVDRTSLGTFLSWMVRDVVKEEMDTMIASGLTNVTQLEGRDGSVNAPAEHEPSKQATSAIALAAKRWFFQNEANL